MDCYPRATLKGWWERTWRASGARCPRGSHDRTISYEVNLVAIYDGSTYQRRYLRVT